MSLGISFWRLVLEGPLGRTPHEMHDVSLLIRDRLTVRHPLIILWREWRTEEAGQHRLISFGVSYEILSVRTSGPRPPARAQP